MKIYTVRHGQTNWNTLGIGQGWVDVPLNVTGQFQALKAKSELKNVTFNTAYSSPLQRAARTCQVILGRFVPQKELFNNLSLEDSIELTHFLKEEVTSRQCFIHYTEDLIERGLGVFEGNDTSRMREISWKDKFNSERFNMESIEHMYIRINRVLEQIQHDSIAKFGSNAIVLVVSHAGVLKLIDYILRGGTKDGLFYSALYDSAINHRFKNCDIQFYEI